MPPFAADPMRITDILGLFAFMAGGLAILAAAGPLGAGLAAMLGAKRRLGGDATAAALARLFATVQVTLIGTAMAVLSALVAMKVLERRPGAYPGGAGTTAAGAAGLLAFVWIAVVRVIPTLRAIGRDYRKLSRDP